MTRTRLWGWLGASDGCDHRRGRLSRYLDNDLRGKEATAMATHLRGCVACRAEFEAMRAQRAILSAAVVPRGAAGARARVLTRFEASVRARSAARPRSRRRPLVLRSAFASVVAIALAGGGTLTAFRAMHSASHPATTAASVPSATPILLAPPSLLQNGDLQALFAQHDGSVTASIAASRPAVTRPVTHPATARIAPHHRSHIATNTQHSADNETTQTVSDEPTPLPADEIPEAL